MPELPGDVAERWRVLGKIGKGGQGTVWELARIGGEQRAVIKCMNDPRGASDYERERFRREIDAIASIEHPNVLRPLEHGWEPYPYFVAEKGEPLDRYWKRLRRNRRDLFELSCRMIRAILSGLRAVHERSLVHRDIKPKNIIVLRGDEPAIADFGIVHVPEAERITERPAGNRMFRFEPAMYDPSLAPPAGDCLCVANLWAWMLAGDASLLHGNYHWRYHRFIPDARCEIVRAVLASCSEPTACPADAGAFIDLLDDHYATTQLEMPSWSEDMKELQTAYSLAKAQAQQQTVSSQSEISTAALGAARFLRPVVESLTAGAERLTSAGMPVATKGKVPPEELRERLEAACALSRKHNREELLVEVVCDDEDCAAFGVSLRVIWHEHFHEDGSLFSVVLRFQHDRFPQLDETWSRYYKVLPDGRLMDFSCSDICSSIRAFLEDKNLWMPRGRSAFSYPPPTGFGGH